MNKVKNRSSSENMNEIFKLRENSHCNIRQVFLFIAPNGNNVFDGIEFFSYIGPKIWVLIPSEIRQISPLPVFKKKIKKWKSEQLLMQNM